MVMSLYCMYDVLLKINQQHIFPIKCLLLSEKTMYFRINLSYLSHKDIQTCVVFCLKQLCSHDLSQLSGEH